MQQARMQCSSRQCVEALGRGRWDVQPHGTATWQWSGPCASCGTRLSMDEASELLAGRRILLIGDSVVRRHLWALVDAVRGPQAQRFRAPSEDGTSPHRRNATSTEAFRAAVGDLMYDEERDRHESQTVLLNVHTKSVMFFSAAELCKLAGLAPAQDLKGCSVTPPGANSTSRSNAQQQNWTLPPFDMALSRAIRKYGPRKLQVTEANASRVIATLTWLYTSSTVPPLSLVQAFGLTSLGVRADATIFGVDHTAVIHPRYGRPYLVPVRARAQAQAWAKVIAHASAKGKMCSPPTVCLVRGVVHNGWCDEDDTLYHLFAQEASHAAASPGSSYHYLDALNTTLDGIRSHAFEHHDTLRIHYNDRGREFLAQLLLNSLAALLRRPDAAASSTDTQVGSEAAATLTLREPLPPFRNVVEACEATDRSTTGLPWSLVHACSECAAGCRHNHSTERWQAMHPTVATHRA